MGLWEGGVVGFMGGMGAFPHTVLVFNDHSMTQKLQENSMTLP